MGKQVLITGATGFLGREVARRLAADGQVVALGYRQAGADAIDLRDPHALAAALDRHRPGAVVHLAAYRDPDFCEADPAEARRLNVEPLRVLCGKLPPGARLLFASSDYVFDGTSPPYPETAERCPVNVYGRTKCEAEDLVLGHPGGLVLRIPLLVGAGPDASRSGFLTQLAAALADPHAQVADDVLVRYPTWTRDVAEAFAFLLARPVRGAFHWSGPDALTRYACLRMVARQLGLSADHVKPSREVVSRPAARPPDSALSTQRLRSLGFHRATPFADVVRAVAEETGLGRRDG